MIRLIIAALLICFNCLASTPPSDSKAKPSACAKCGSIGTAIHKRVDIKDRKMPGSINTDRVVDITEMIEDWDVPPTNPAKHKTFSTEDSIFTVTGFLRLIKLAPDDCDYHLEIGADESNGVNRIIAEIPNTTAYCALRTKFLDQLNAKFGIESLSSTPKRFTSKIGIPRIKVTGYAFLDTAHRLGDDPTDPQGHGHGSPKVATLWEIHPILDLEIMNHK